MVGYFNLFILFGKLYVLKISNIVTITVGYLLTNTLSIKLLKQN